MSELWRVKIGEHEVIAQVHNRDPFALRYSSEDGIERFMLLCQIVDSPTLEKGTVHQMAFQRDGIQIAFPAGESKPTITIGSKE